MPETADRSHSGMYSWGNCILVRFLHQQWLQGNGNAPITSNHGVHALAWILRLLTFFLVPCYILSVYFSLRKINSLFYKSPWQPYISTLIDMCPFHSTGRKRTYRALIGGFKWWKTGVLWSVFPDNSYNENSSVNLSGCCWFIGCSWQRKALDKSLSSRQSLSWRPKENV